MAAGHVGSVWVDGSWSDTVWLADSWADLLPFEPRPSFGLLMGVYKR